MKDYSHLEGKEITYKYDDDPEEEEFQGIVVGLDYDIGVSIVNKNDKDQHLVCLNGPFSPNYNHFNDNDMKRYKRTFFHYVAAIKKGYAKGEIAEKVYNGKHCCLPSKNPTINDCPFGQ